MSRWSSKWRDACLSRAGTPPDPCVTEVKGSPIILGGSGLGTGVGVEAVKPYTREGAR